MLDPDVKGEAARGYLWFYAVPGGASSWSSIGIGA
jgi:hypothetical protein